MEGRNRLVEKGMWLVGKGQGFRGGGGGRVVENVDRGCGLLVSRGVLWVSTDIYITVEFLREFS